MNNEQCPLYSVCRTAKELEYERSVDSLLSGADLPSTLPSETVNSFHAKDPYTQKLLTVFKDHQVQTQRVIREGLLVVAENNLFIKKIEDDSIERDEDNCPGPNVTRAYRWFGKKTIECSSPERIERAKRAQEIIYGA